MLSSWSELRFLPCRAIPSFGLHISDYLMVSVYAFLDAVENAIIKLHFKP